MRYRLRFLLQEFDLRGPEVTIGRSPDCHITIEDPLVSRRHARILIDADGARVEDHESRNGVRVNGKRIRGTHDLADGDRVRIGTQELVFNVAQPDARRSVKTTGFMHVCHACSTPFPEQSPTCPHCGAPRREEDTSSGLIVEPTRSWTFQLLGEVIERALSQRRAAEAELPHRVIQGLINEAVALLALVRDRDGEVRDGPRQPGGPSHPSCGSCYWNVTDAADVKFETAPPPDTSRCQAWKNQVEPAVAWTLPVGCGIAVRSIGRQNQPDGPEFSTWPGPT